MAPLTSEAALALHRKLQQRNAAQRAAELAAAKAAALQQGKEAFDLHKLEAMCDTSEAGRLADEQERHARYEYLYYVECADVRTLQAFAHIVTELSSWE